MHSLNENMEDLEPWYKQFWPWVLVALPLASVIAGLSTLYIAVVNQDSLIIEKWSKDGKAIYSDVSLFKAAEKLGLSGQLKIDYVTGEIFLQLLSDGNEEGKEKDEKEAYTYPEILFLSIIHPTMASKDQNISLSKVTDNNYRGQLDHQIEANRSLFLSDLNESWQIKINIEIPTKESVSFTTDPSSILNK